MNPDEQTTLTDDPGNSGKKNPGDRLPVTVVPSIDRSEGPPRRGASVPRSDPEGLSAVADPETGNPALPPPWLVPPEGFLRSVTLEGRLPRAKGLRSAQLRAIFPGPLEAREGIRGTPVRRALQRGLWTAVRRPGSSTPGLHTHLLRATVRLRGARVRQNEGEPAGRGKEPGRRREELRKRTRGLLPRGLLPRIRVSTPVSRPAVRRVRHHQVERTGVDPGDLPPKIPGHGGQAPVRAILEKIPAREIEQGFLKFHADAGAQRGGQAGQEQQQDPAPCPQIENGPAAVRAANPARITESIGSRYPRSAAG